MSLSSSSSLLKQTHSIIVEHQLENATNLNLTSIQESLEISNEKISYLRDFYLNTLEKDSYNFIIEETSSLIGLLAELILPSIENNQSIQGVGKLYNTYTQLKELYQKELSELEKSEQTAKNVDTTLFDENNNNNNSFTKQTFPKPEQNQIKTFSEKVEHISQILKITKIIYGETHSKVAKSLHD